MVNRKYSNKYQEGGIFYDDEKCGSKERTNAYVAYGWHGSTKPYGFYWLEWTSPEEDTFLRDCIKIIFTYSYLMENFFSG